MIITSIPHTNYTKKKKKKLLHPLCPSLTKRNKLPYTTFSRDEIQQKGAIKSTFFTDFALITENFAKNRYPQVFPFNFTSSFCLFSQQKTSRYFFLRQKKKHEEPKKKINKLNTYITQVLQTGKNINFAKILLKDIKPYLSTSADRIIKRKLQLLSSIIEQIQQNQLDSFMNTKIKLEKMLKNATIAYRETLDNCYLDTIKDLKNVLTQAKHTHTIIYNPTIS